MPLPPLLREREKASVKGPTLPANIINISPYFWISFSFGVTPIDNPTVPKAETVSKRYSTKKWRLSVGWPPPAIKRTDVMIAIENAEAKMIEIDRLTISLGTVRLKIFKSRFPYSRFHMSMTSRAALVVLTPPPVDPGEAPINIRTSIRRMVALVRAPISTVLNPHVRGVIDWKKEAKILFRIGTSLMI